MHIFQVQQTYNNRIHPEVEYFRHKNGAGLQTVKHPIILEKSESPCPTASLMYHAFGLSDCAYVHQKFVNGSIVFHVRPRWLLVRCPIRRASKVIRRGICLRLRHTVPIGFRPFWLLDAQKGGLWLQGYGVLQAVYPGPLRGKYAFAG